MVARHTLVATGLLSLACLTCAPASRHVDSARIELDLHELLPRTLLPGTTLLVEGDAFVDESRGQSHLRLEGTFVTREGGSFPVDVRLPTRFADTHRLEASLSDAALADLGGRAGTLVGTAVVEVRRAVDGRIDRSPAIDIEVDLAHTLAPNLELSLSSGLVFPNQPIALQGDGLLLPDEGRSIVVLEGCFQAWETDTCAPLPPRELVLEPMREGDRTQAQFVFGAEVVGIEPGRFDGSATIVNEHADGTRLSSASQPCAWDLERPTIHLAPPQTASLGKYVTVRGAGFVGGARGYTQLVFTGHYIPNSGDPIELEEILIPEFIDGSELRYVVNEDDNIGQMLDVRYDAGIFIGTLQPQISYDGVEVEGDPVAFDLELQPVRQIVYLNFLPSYVESLRSFGLRALDQHIRERVLEVVRRDFETINVEFREEPPLDYAWYTQVDIAGPDPNGLGLLGYDNTPGKDVNNERLYDRIGGVNALTQEDGWPGYGGVFIESLFGYSTRPPAHVPTVMADPRFDALFDPFREDRGGRPVRSADLSGMQLPRLDSGGSCPSQSDERLPKIACAVYALGNLIGTTVSHELGHSLGLANPHGDPLEFHNRGNVPNRMMDADRPFSERAEIAGEGPSRFCAEEYRYLRDILPSNAPLDPTPRPPC